MSALAVNPLSHRFDRPNATPDNAAMHKKKRPTPLGRLMEAYNDGAGITDNELARSIGLSQSTVTRIATGETKNPDEATLRPLADFFGVSTGRLRGEDEDEPDLPLGKYVHIPEYRSTLGLGRGRHNPQHEEVSGTQAYRADFIRDNGWSVENLAVVYGEGDSMQPNIRHGDRLLVNLAQTKIIDGRVYAIEDVDEGTQAKRLYKTRDRRIRVASDNQATGADGKRVFPDKYITPDSRTRIIGEIVDRAGPV